MINWYVKTPSAPILSPQSNTRTMDNWLRRNNVKLPSFEPATKATHYSMKGGPYGRIQVPDRLASDFLRQLGESLMKGEAMHWAEKRTPVFKLFVDIDLKIDVSIYEVTSVLQEVVQRKFPSLQPHAIACWPRVNNNGVFEPPEYQERKKEDGSVEVVFKNGCHITWTNIFVDTPTALGMRLAWIKRCKECINDEIDWGQILDACVYTTNGLRMIGCYKGDQRSPVYVPFQEMIGDEEKKLTGNYLQDAVEFVRKTSIRLQPDVGLTPTRVIKDEDYSNCKKRKHPAGPVTMAHPDQEVVLDAMRAVLPRVWKDSKIYITKQSKYKGMPSWLVSSTSRFCLNVGREHNSSKVYFDVTPEYMRQRCYSDKDTLQGRIYCKCRNYVSKKIMFPPQTRKALAELPLKPLK